MRSWVFDARHLFLPRFSPSLHVCSKEGRGKEEEDVVGGIGGWGDGVGGIGGWGELSFPTLIVTAPNNIRVCIKR